MHLLQVEQHELDGEDIFISGPFGVLTQQPSAVEPRRPTVSREKTPSLSQLCAAIDDEEGTYMKPTCTKEEAPRQSTTELQRVRSSTKPWPAPGSPSLAAGLQNDLLVDVLLGHYIQTVSNILQPVRHPGNAYSSLYGSRAMSVAKKLSWSDAVQHLQVSDCKVALLCSLLASSSFHLRESDKFSDADATARFFRSKAISHLRQALSTRTTTGQPGLQVLSRSVASSRAVLSVMLTLITADVSRACILL